MDSDRSMMELERELLQAEHVLNTEYSFDLAEPNYLRCLQVIQEAPELQPQVEALLIELFETRRVSDEPIAYLMHKLRWPGVQAWMERKLKELPHSIAGGVSYEKVLAAYSDSWENREFYKGL